MSSIKLQEYINFKPFFHDYKNGNRGKKTYYETTFYCGANKIIHPNLKAAINCPHCFTDKERKEFKTL